ncbi:HNH endonuclease [Streptomyces decoyicus]|uniref:HNH endonuclease n=1 Tax=Streptomyces decoyicus TaxID=249567 RepID=UPI00398D0BA6
MTSLRAWRPRRGPGRLRATRGPRYGQVRRHEFENLIALCPTCHALFDRGHLDRVSMFKYKANLSPFSPYALAAHPDHIDFLAAYQKFRVFIETWLTAALAFQEAEQRGSSTSELRGSFQAIGHAAKEASYARLCFCAVYGTALRTPGSACRQ